MKKRNFRPGEVDANTFRNLPNRCQELFFEYLSKKIENEQYRDLLIWEVIGFPEMEFYDSPIEVILDFAFTLRAFERNEPEWMYLQKFESIEVNGRKYNPDFLFSSKIVNEEHDEIIIKNNIDIIIECDGHEFHEKTKQQVEYRNNRDYDLKLAGYDVLHFSGSQIYNDPWECVDKIIDYIKERIVINGRC